MHDTYSNDILQPLCDNHLLEYAKYYENHLPKFIRAYNFLYLQSKWKAYEKLNENNPDELSPICKYSIFKYNSGTTEYCTFFGIAKDEQTIYFDSLENENNNNCIEIKECLENTKRIKWELKPIFQAITVTHKRIDLLKSILTNKNIKYTLDLRNIAVWIPIEKGLTLKYEIPTDIYWSPLKPDDSNLIDSLWPHRFPNSDNYIRSLIILNGGIGIYRKETNELLSWVICNDFLAAGFLQTIETEQGKGYGKLIMKIYIKDFIKKENLPVTATIVTTNKISKKLFKDLAFEEYDVCSWFFI